MKIGWVTPLAQNSAIGRASAIVCEALAARGHLVDIIRAESRDAIGSPHLPTSLRVLSSHAVSYSEAVDSYDAVFLNVGDNFGFHGGIFEYLRHPFAIGIFHDFYLFNLFNGWRQTLDLKPIEASREIVSVYGPSFADVALRAIDGSLDMAELARAVPMTEWVAMRCAGAIAHARFYLPRLRSACAGPVEVANLPWPGRDVPPPLPRDGKLTIVTVGLVNPNKCVDQVVEAIGQSAILRERLRYVVAGPIDDAMRSRLEEKAHQRGVDFAALGSVSDEELQKVLAEADVMCCLRRPVLEGASASAIEGMLSGRPIIVADAGFYAELPEQCAIKVPADFDVADLAAALERMVLHPAERLRMGEEARAWATDTFSVQAYVKVIESVAQDQIRLAPYLELSDRVADRLHRLGIGNSAVSAERFGAAIDGMRRSDAPSMHRI